VAAVIDDGDLIDTEALHGVGDEMADGINLIGIKAAAADIYEHGGRGFHALLGEEEPILRLHDHDASGAHTLHLDDGAAELALEGAEVICALHEVGETELALVENLEAHTVSARDTLAGKIHAKLVHLIGGHLHGGAAGGDLVRDVLRLEIADDGGGVLVPHAGVEELVIRTLRPKDDPDESARNGERGHHKGDALIEAELLPKGDERVGEIFHRTGRGSRREKAEENL